MNITAFLEQKIEDSYRELEETSMDDQKKQEALSKRLSLLVTKAVEAEKIDLENELKSRQFDEEIDFKRNQLTTELDIKVQQLEDNRKDRKWQYVLTGASIVIPTLVTVWGTLKSLKFEEEGTITTSVGREFIRELFKRK